MYTGPKLHNDQLVFGYDTGYGLDQHSSTRHYKGEPATNLITAGLPGYFGSGGETLYRSNYYGLNSDSGVFQRNFVSNPALADSSTYNNNAGLYQDFTTAALSSNTEYVLVSFDFYMITPYVRHSSSGTGLNGYMRIGYTDGTFTSHSWNTSLNTPNAGDDWNNNSDYIGQWRKIGLYVDLNNSKTPSSITHTYIYNDRTITGEGIFTNFIITEHVTLPTAPVNYTSGTRSSTQSIIDLKRTTNIDVSNVSFDSTGQPTFDGTNDYIYIDEDILNVSSFTVEAIVNITSTGNNNKPIFTCGNLSSTGIWFLKHRSGLGNRLVMHGYDGVNPRVDVQSTNVVPDAENTHVAVTFNGTSYQLYINGVADGNAVNDNAVAASNDNYIGRQSSSSAYLLGDIPVLKIYSVALSADEIQQNFNAYKNRFNI